MFSIFDIESGEAVASYDAKKDLSSVCWNWTGSSCIVATPADKSIRMLDPRTRELSLEIDNAYTANKPIICEWAGKSEYAFISCGHSMNRDREICVWDARNASKAVSRQRADQNSGLLRPLFDPDTNLVFFSGHGDSIIRVFEIDESLNLHAIGNFILTDPARSSFLIPKPACDVMGCEIDRVLRLVSGQIEGVRVEVPRRKAYRDFQEDIFPDTKAPQETLSLEQYKNGEIAEPVLQSVKALAAIHSTSEETQERAQREEEEDTTEREERERQEKAELDRLAEKSDELDKRFSKFLGYQAKMKFTRGTQSKRDESVYNMTPDCGGSDSTNLACSSKFFAVPWKGNAGPVYVGSMTKPGKIAIPQDVPVLNGHGNSVSCLTFDEFDDSLLVTGSDDCTIRLWRIPETGINTIDDAAHCLQGSVKLEGGHRLSVRGVQFHRLCKDLLTSFGSEPSVKLWDVNSQQCLLELDESTLSATGSAANLDWSYDGNQMAIAGRDSMLRMVDPRAFKTKLIHSFTTHEGSKGSRVCWLGREPALVTTGFGKTGDRQFKLWDCRMFGTDRNRPLSVNSLDPGAGVILPYYVEDNGVLVLYAKGELAIRIYEIEGLALAKDFAEVGKQKRETKKFDLHKCTEYRCQGEPTAGLAFLPRRVCNYKQAEWLTGLRLTPTMVETISFTVPRSTEIQGYFYDDLYPPARSSEPALTDPKAWFKNEANCDGPKRVDMNKDKLKVLSQRPAAESNLAMKRGVASTDRMRKEQEEEARRKREQQEALDRMQRLAVQHEQYNPNMSKPGMGHDASGSHAVETGPSDVNDEEWGD